MSAIVPGADWRTGIATGDDAKFGKWRSADEALVGIYFVGGGMIDGQQADLVEVNGFFHGFEEAEAEQAVARANAAGVDFEIFVGIGDVALAGSDPVADYAGANHVGDEFVLAAIPGKEDRAGTAAAVEFGYGIEFFGGEIYFVLRNAGGPEQTDHFDIFFGAEAGENGIGILAEIAGGCRRLPISDRARRRRASTFVPMPDLLSLRDLRSMCIQLCALAPSERRRMGGPPSWVTMMSGSPYAASVGDGQARG